MRVTFLGTGAAGGVPLYGCDCLACQRALVETSAVRRPCCALVESGATRVLLDAGLMDLHQRFPPGSLDAIVLTHYHPDHVQGLFHLRWGVGAKIPVRSPNDATGCADLHRNPGLLDFQPTRKFEPIKIGDLTLTPLPLIHSKPTLGYAIESAHGERFAYLTDTIGLPPKTEDFLARWGRFSMAVDCSFPPREEPGNHNDWTSALDCIAKLSPENAWLTHIGHKLDTWLLTDKPVLPAGVRLAIDGESADIGSRR